MDTAQYTDQVLKGTQNIDTYDNLICLMNEYGDRFTGVTATNLNHSL